MKLESICFMSLSASSKMVPLTLIAWFLLKIKLTAFVFRSFLRARIQTATVIYLGTKNVAADTQALCD